MCRLLATFIFAYAGISAAQWSAATRWLYGSPGRLWCGNVVSDPYMLLINVLAPSAAVANIALVYRGVKTRRWPPYMVTAMLAFVATSGCLVYEGYLLRSKYGIPLGDVWWLPGL